MFQGMIRLFTLEEVRDVFFTEGLFSYYVVLVVVVVVQVFGLLLFFF